MTFEYKVVRFVPYGDETEDRLNEHGADGWMIVHVEEENPGSGMLVIFMRQRFDRPTSPEEYFGETP